MKKEEEEHKKHEGRHKYLITEFFQLRLRLRAQLNQWGGLHILNGMKRREYNHQVHKKEYYTFNLKNG